MAPLKPYNPYSLSSLLRPFSALLPQQFAAKKQQAQQAPQPTIPTIGGTALTPVAPVSGAPTVAPQVPQRPTAPTVNDLVYRGGPVEINDLVYRGGPVKTTLLGNQQPSVPNVTSPTQTPAQQPQVQTEKPQGGMYTVASGDTLSAIAARNGLSLNQILDANPQFRVNPNLIRPGQSVSIPSGATLPAPSFNTQPAPAVSGQPGTITTPSGAVVNPATGGVVSGPAQQPQLPATPATQATPATPSPIQNPLFTSPEYEAASRDVEKNLQLSPEEISGQEEINKLQESYRKAYQGESERAIPLEFITGRQKALEQRALNLAQPIQAQAALAQAKRQAALEASKLKLETEGAKIGAYREYSKPIAVAPGSTLVNPFTGETKGGGIASLTDKQALDTFFNLSQTYPDAGIRWDDALTPQQNLAAAQKAASGSESFAARNTIYAINPLTGEPTLISKLGGAGQAGAGGTSFGTGGGIPSVENLAPELKAALNSVEGIRYFDSSQVTQQQIPYLQRASQQFGIPFLAKEDAKAIQVDSQKYQKARSLMDSILELTPKVIKAENNPASMTAQAARLRAIQIAPTLSTDNDTKALLATLNSFTSLLTRAAGEVGVLTDMDVARIRQALPAITDNKDLAIQKASQLDDVFRATLQGSIQTYIGNKTAAGGFGTEGGSDPLGLFK